MGGACLEKGADDFFALDRGKASIGEVGYCCHCGREGGSRWSASEIEIPGDGDETEGDGECARNEYEHSWMID